MSQNKRRLAHIYIMLLSLCAALSLMPSAVSAQHTIKTVIVDSITRIPLPGANAIVFSTDSSFIKGTTSDTAGVVKFDLSPHSPYILRISMIGYKSLFFNIPKGILIACNALLFFVAVAFHSPRCNANFTSSEKMRKCYSKNKTHPP